MRRMSSIGVVLLAVLAAVSLTAWAQSARPVPAQPAAVVWEYRSFQRPTYTAEGLDSMMNECGAQGWEYVDAHQATLNQDDVPRPVTVYVFKRAKAAGGR